MIVDEAAEVRCRHHSRRRLCHLGRVCCQLDSSPWVRVGKNSSNRQNVTGTVIGKTSSTLSISQCSIGIFSPWVLCLCFARLYALMCLEPPRFSRCVLFLATENPSWSSSLMKTMRVSLWMDLNMDPQINQIYSLYWNIIIASSFLTRRWRDLLCFFYVALAHSVPRSAFENANHQLPLDDYPPPNSFPFVSSFTFRRLSSHLLPWDPSNSFHQHWPWTLHKRQQSAFIRSSKLPFSLLITLHKVGSYSV